jgi:hypothetical protein
VLGIPLLYQIIIGHEDGYHSFADAGALEPQTGGYREVVLRENE